MCGISGLFGLSGPIPPAVAAALGPMTGAIAHRGPDGEGLFADERCGLGHRRLAIIDVATGAQPIANEDGTAWIVFNGEVYNHHHLRERLEARGHVFRTRTDTEAILHAYEEFGPSCVDHLEGMFAFAIYDQPHRRLFLARDRLGKKPLYYGVFDGVLHVASEIKALRRSPAWNGEIDERAIEGYLSLGYVMAPETIYRRVRSLPPAHWMLASDGRITTGRYWDVADFDTDRRDGEAIARDLDRLIGEAVAERLESEVPLGAFLSGGIDSGLVVSFMAERMNAPVNTTSVGFGDAAHNELDGAALTAARYATDHHAEVVEPALDDVLAPIVEAFDQPFADSSAVPTFYVSAMARRRVTVALSGDGGDEVFGGYSFRYTPHALEDRLRGFVPGAPGRAALRGLGRVWPRSRRLPRPLRLSTILENLGGEAVDAYFADLCFLKPRDTGWLTGRASLRDPRDSQVYAAVTDPYRRCPSPSAVQRAQYADLHTYLPNDVLVKVDRMSMQHALEIRSPLLDRRIVEFGFRVPTATKMPRLRSKALLKRLAAERLPAPLLGLPKHGFTAPVGAWVTGPSANAFLDETLGPDAFVARFLDRSRVREAFDQHRRGVADRSYLLWAVWVLERWGRQQTA